MRGLVLLALLAGCRHERPVSDEVVAALRAAAADLDDAVLDAALGARACAVRAGDVAPLRRQPLLAVVDFSTPSTERRLWVLDLRTGTLRWHEWVAHGSGGDGAQVPVFSDVEGSHCSSVGAFATGETYTGRHGLSLRLDGLEPGFNAQARAREIVVHGADYVSEAHIAGAGRLGRSWGCPAVRPAVSEELARALAGGAMWFQWGEEDAWQSASALLACARGERPTRRALR
jgi:hypothetical protein